LTLFAADSALLTRRIAFEEEDGEGEEGKTDGGEVLQPGSERQASAGCKLRGAK